MPKNYYLFFHEGKVKRQAINLNEIYPESYAEKRIPDNSDIFARIITSDTTNKKWNGYRSKGLKSSWLKCAMWTSFYPDNLTIEFKDAILYHDAQKDYIDKYIPLLTQDERESLQDSTDKINNRLWTEV